MALSPPRLITPEVASSGTPVTTAAFSPLANEDLIVRCFARTPTGAAVDLPEIANSAGLTFSLLSSVSHGALVRQRVWRVNVGASPPASMTVTGSATGSPQAIILTVLGESGASGDYSNIVSATSTVGDLTIVLPIAPAANSIVIGFFGVPLEAALVAGPASHILLSSIPAASSCRSWVGYDPAPAAASAFYDTAATDTRRSLAHLIEVKNVPAAAGGIAVPLALSTSFARQLAAGRAQAVTMALDMTMTGSIATVASPENPAGTWRSSVRTWAMPSGVDPIAGDNLTFSSGSTAPPSGFVVVADLIGLTRPSAQIIRPTSAQLFNDEPGNTNTSENQNFNNITGFTATTNLTLDLRGKKFYHHSTTGYTGDGGTPAARSVLRPDNYRNGLCIYGAEIIGEQIDNTVWRTMKVSNPPNPLNMDDNAIDFRDGGAPASSTVYVEACVLRKSFDGVNTDNAFALDPTNKVTFIVRGCYAEKQRDEFVENDGLSKLEIYDCLVDSCHNFVSMRPGDSSPAIPPNYSNSANWVKCYNVLARCRGQYYTTDIAGDIFPFGTKRDPQWEPTNGSIFVANPSTYGPGWVHREPWKGDFVETFTDLNSTIWVDCRDSIFAFESLPTSRKVVFPPGTYDNVYLLYLPDLSQGFTINDLVDSRYVQDRGITVLSGAAARTLWNTERQNWITAHGGVVGTDGLLRFPFHTLAGTRPYPIPADPDTVRDSYGTDAGGRVLYVQSGGSGNNVTDPAGGGNFEATVRNALDNDRVIVKAGDHPLFSASPRSGETGRIQILANTNVFSGLDFSMPGGGMTGVSAASAQSHITGEIVFNGFDNMWVEGFRMGVLDINSQTIENGAFTFSGNVATTARTWIVKNFIHNARSLGTIVGGMNRFCYFNNFSSCNNYNNGRPNWAMDYHLFIEGDAVDTVSPTDDENVRDCYVFENFFRGGANQCISMKRNVQDVFVNGNSFMHTIITGGNTDGVGTSIFCGQDSDKSVTGGQSARVLGEHTIGNAVISHNQWLVDSAISIIHISNIRDIDINNNTFTETAGTGITTNLFRIYTGSNNAATVLPPYHPRDWIIQNNTFASPTRQRVVFGRSFVNVSVQECHVRIRNNTATSALASQMEDGQQNFSTPAASHGSAFDANAQMRVTLGPNSRVAVPNDPDGRLIVVVV